MKRMFLGVIVLMVLTGISIPAMAQVDVHINIPLPPAIKFISPPRVVVIPQTYVYVDPDVSEDLYFWNGFWWRLWKGRWYRSRYYDRGWIHFKTIPTFYRRIPPRWRDNYRDHRWEGREWEYKRIKHKDLEKNWNRWEKNRHWEKQGNWHVKGLTHKNQKKKWNEKKRQEQRKKQKDHFKKQREHQERNRDFKREKHEGNMKEPRGEKNKSRPDGNRDDRERHRRHER